MISPARQIEKLPALTFGPDATVDTLEEFLGALHGWTLTVTTETATVTGEVRGIWLDADLRPEVRLGETYVPLRQITSMAVA